MHIKSVRERISIDEFKGWLGLDCIAEMPVRRVPQRLTQRIHVKFAKQKRAGQ